MNNEKKINEQNTPETEHLLTETDPANVHYLTQEEQKVKEQEILDYQSNAENMLTLTFLNDGFGWFADVANHTRGQNSMVCGADKLVDHMAAGHNRVDVRFRTVRPKRDDHRKTICTLKRFFHHSGGAEYLVHGVGAIPFPAFICDVCHDVTGEHPKFIAVYAIEPKDDPRMPERTRVDVDLKGRPMV